MNTTPVIQLVPAGVRIVRVGLAEVVGGEQAAGGQDDRADRAVGDRPPGGAGVVESVGVERLGCVSVTV